jgi:hypothetical protein
MNNFIIKLLNYVFVAFIIKTFSLKKSLKSKSETK